MRLPIALAAAMFVTAPAWANDMTISAVVSIPCNAFLVAQGTPLYGQMQAPLTEYLQTKDKKGSLGSACNMMDYVTVVCKRHPAYTVGQASDRLLSLVHSGKPLPPIPQCGA